MEQLLSGQPCVLLNQPLFQKSQQHVPSTVRDRADFEQEQRDAPHRGRMIAVPTTETALADAAHGMEESGAKN
jgi:hypothetical protein